MPQKTPDVEPRLHCRNIQPNNAIVRIGQACIPKVPIPRKECGALLIPQQGNDIGIRVKPMSKVAPDLPDANPPGCKLFPLARYDIRIQNIQAALRVALRRWL